MIVADTNLVAYCVIPGACTLDALKCRARDRTWIAPVLLRSELLNSIAKYTTRSLLDRDEGLKAFRRGIGFVSSRRISLCDGYFLK